MQMALEEARSVRLISILAAKEVASLSIHSDWLSIIYTRAHVHMALEEAKKDKYYFNSGCWRGNISPCILIHWGNLASGHHFLRTKQHGVGSYGLNNRVFLQQVSWKAHSFSGRDTPPPPPPPNRTWALEQKLDSEFFSGWDAPMEMELGLRSTSWTLKCWVKLDFMLCMGVQASNVPWAFSWLNCFASFIRRKELIPPVSIDWVT